MQYYIQVYKLHDHQSLGQPPNVWKTCFKHNRNIYCKFAKNMNTTKQESANCRRKETSKKESSNYVEVSVKWVGFKVETYVIFSFHKRNVEAFGYYRHQNWPLNFCRPCPKKKKKNLFCRPNHTNVLIHLKRVKLKVTLQYDSKNTSFHKNNFVHKKKKGIMNFSVEIINLHSENSRL